MSGNVRDDSFWNMPPEPAGPAQACPHPVTRRYAWVARDDSEPDGEVLVIACCDCGAVLQGAGELGAAGAA